MTLIWKTQKQNEAVKSSIRFLWLAILWFTFSGNARAAQVSLAWDAATNPAVSGYFIYSGTNSGIYTTNWDAGTNTMVKIPCPNNGVTYYFVVTAHDADGMESMPSVEISTTVSNLLPPGLAIIPDQTINAGQSLSVVPDATNFNTNGAPLTFSLLTAPAGMRIDSVTGVISWVPSMAQAGGSNAVIVQVSDAAMPELSTSQIFNVTVGDFVQISLSSAVMSSSGAGIVAVTINSSGPITNLAFTVDVPANWVSGVTAQSLLPDVAIVTQDVPGATHSQITVQTINGQVLQGQQVVLQLVLTPATAQVQGFTSVQASAVTASSAAGQLVPGVAGSSARQVIVGGGSFLDLQPSQGQYTLNLYGPAGSYQIDSTTDLSGNGIWKQEFSATLTNLSQSFPIVPAPGEPMKFYRARQL